MVAGGEDFDLATAVTGADGQYQATLSPAWDIWGPVGGYVAAILLRAGAAHTDFPKPASIACHFLGVARFEPVDLAVATERKARRAESVRISMTQGGRPVASALAWFCADGDGYDHIEVTPPDVPPPDDLPTGAERMAAVMEQGADPPPPQFPFWDNLTHWPTRWNDEWPPPGPLPADWCIWARYTPRATFDGPVMDACRSLLLADFQWPAATGPHAWRYPMGQLPYIAPTLDLAVQFHQFAPDEPVLLLEATAPVAAGGLIGGSARVWSQSGRLLASGAGQLMCRPVPQPPAG